MSIAINIPTVNYHLWKPCNMRCEFCFATFEDIEATHSAQRSSWAREQPRWLWNP